MTFYMKKYFKLYLIYALIATTIVFLIYYFYNSKEQILKYIDFNKKIIDIMVLNKDIDILINNKIDQINHDEIKINLQNFEKKLEQIRRDNIYKNAIKHTKVDALFLKIQNNFQDKKTQVEKYQAYIAVINNSLRYLPTLSREISKHNHTEISIKISHFFGNIAQFTLNKKVSKKEFGDSINSIKNTVVQNDLLNQKIDLFITHALSIYSNYNALDLVLIKSNNLKLDLEIEKFSTLINNYLDNTIKSAIATTYFLITALFFLTVFMSLIFYFKRKSEIQLKYFKEGVDKSDNSIILTDRSKNIIYVNEAFEKSSGYKKEEIIGKNPRVLKANIKSQKFYDDLHGTITEGKRWFGEFINRRKDGTIFYEKASIIPIFDTHNEIKYYMSIKLDITKDKKYQRSIEEKNREITKRYYFDNLTNLPNRNKIIDTLETKKEFTLMLVNIDAFKEINDFYGIKIGDSIIQKAAGILQSTRSRHDFQVYRLHADEFGILINKVLNQIETIGFINSIEKSISNNKLHTKYEQNIPFSTTTGVSYSKPFKVKNRKILIQANIALKYAKAHNDTFAVFNKTIDVSKKYENNILWLTKLKDAIAEDRIIPYFQPVVDERNKNVLYYEALIRLIERDGTIISPFMFLDISKKAKLYSSLTKIMINKTFDTFADNDECFSINFSYEDVINKDVLKLLTEKLQEYKNPYRFTAEIVETENISNYDVVKNFIDIIKVFGCKVAIDDFGSGYSSFERVFELNVDYLKIDGSIIKNIDNNEQLRIITETISQFAKKSNMKIVAEFVCRESIVNTLRELDIQYMQGYYFSSAVKDISMYQDMKTIA